MATFLNQYIFSVNFKPTYLYLQLSVLSIVIQKPPFAQMETSKEIQNLSKYIKEQTPQDVQSQFIYLY